MRNALSEIEQEARNGANARRRSDSVQRHDGYGVYAEAKSAIQGGGAVRVLRKTCATGILAV